jgi:hypothetical protein
MKEVFISREAPAVDGESTDKDHKIASIFPGDSHAPEPSRDFSALKIEDVEGESAKAEHKNDLGFFSRDQGHAPSPPGLAEHVQSSLLADRTDVTDSHDRFANLVSAEDPDTDLPDDDLPDADMPDSDFPDGDDHFESSTLLSLHADTDVHEMLPGLAGDISDSLDTDLDFDVDHDADVDADTDESDL